MIIFWQDLEQIVPAEIDDVVNELERLQMPNSGNCIISI
jgi:hypothetical protein